MLMKFRNVIAITTIVTLLISAFWATSPYVLSDVIKGETVVVNASPNSLVALHNDDIEDHKTSDYVCNHGCQVASHLLGMIQPETVQVNAPLMVQVFFVSSDNQFSSPFLQGPFRPPVTLPLV